MSKKADLKNAISNSKATDGTTENYTADGALLDKAMHLHEKRELENQKPEMEKQHDRYRAAQKRAAYEYTYEVKPPKPKKRVPGLEFEGPLHKLAKKYKTLDEITKHMTLGQLSKYYEKDGMLMRVKDGEIVFNTITGECYGS